MFNSTELTNEYNLLNDFLNSSLLDDPFYQTDPTPTAIPPADSTSLNAMASTSNLGNGWFGTTSAPPQNGVSMQHVPGTATPKTSGAAPSEKTKENYFMEAADPAGAAPPEERMNKLLHAKYKAGLLKPFNYVGGYARLNEWMSRNLHSSSKNRITQQFDKFRPTFRERIKPLNDIQLTQVEMWFERELMKYDRVFASMAIPACCWRRTGEIYRGNREMTDILGVQSVDDFREVGIPRFCILRSLTVVAIGKAGITQYPGRRVFGGVLGEVHCYCIRRGPEGHFDELSPEES